MSQSQHTPKKFVIKVGGSLLFEKGKIRIQKIQEFAQTLQNTKNLAAIIVGGGDYARVYIDAARNFEAGESMCDTLGLEIARLNARLLISALGDIAYPEPIRTLEDARIAHLTEKIILAGGFVPGQSTTSVTFQIAETLKATDILVLTNVDGIYDKDPKKHKDAKKFDRITIDHLENVILGGGGETQAAAGEYRIFDAVSIQIFKRNTINVRLLSGENPEDIKKVLSGSTESKQIGTIILRK